MNSLVKYLVRFLPCFVLIHVGSRHNEQCANFSHHAVLILLPTSFTGHAKQVLLGQCKPPTVDAFLLRRVGGVSAPIIIKARTDLQPDLN